MSARTSSENFDHLSQALAEFARELSAIVNEGGTEYELTERVASRLAPLLQVDGLIPAPFTRTKPGGYVLYPLVVASDGSFCVAAAVWDVGQETPIHDHGTWGVVGIYRGAEHEVRYRQPQESGLGPLEMLDEHVIEPGGVVICCTTDQDIHKVSAATDTPCIAVHVYGADIGAIERRAYDPETGAVHKFVSGWAQAVPVA